MRFVSHWLGVAATFSERNYLVVMTRFASYTSGKCDIKVTLPRVLRLIWCHLSGNMLHHCLELICNRNDCEPMAQNAKLNVPATKKRQYYQNRAPSEGCCSGSSAHEDPLQGLRYLMWTLGCIAARAGSQKIFRAAFILPLPAPSIVNTSHPTL